MSTYTPGPLGIAILRTVSGGRDFIANTPGQQRAALKLNERGLIDRDLGRNKSNRFIGNDAGTRFIQQHDDALAGKAGLE